MLYKHISHEQTVELLDEDYLALINQLRSKCIMWAEKFPEHSNTTLQILESYFKSKQTTANLSPKEFKIVVL